MKLNHSELSYLLDESFDSPTCRVARQVYVIVLENYRICFDDIWRQVSHLGYSRRQIRALVASLEICGYTKSVSFNRQGVSIRVYRSPSLSDSAALFLASKLREWSRLS